MRVPVSGEVILFDGDGIKTESSAINISVGGLCITDPGYPVDQKEYQIQIITPTLAKIHFSGFPVYQNKTAIGLKITKIEKDQLKKILEIVEHFQISDDFIKSVNEKDIIKDWLVDKSGDDIAITFETEVEKNI